MRPCPTCGTLVGETDDFCGNCGTFLGWGPRQPGQPDVESTVEPDDAVEAPKPVQPAVPIAPRPADDTAVAEPNVDGPPCPNCGTTNPPDRRYCRKCAYPLTQQEQPTVDRTRRHRRRGGSGRLWRTIVVLAVVAVLVGVGFALRPLGGRLFQDILDKTSQPGPIHPVAETASASVPGHPAAMAVDGLSNRYWGTTGVGQSIDFRFDHPFRLLSLVITTGAATEPKQYTAQARPTQFDLVVTSSDGTATTVPVSLADQPGPQTVQTGVSDVVGVKLVIRAVSGLRSGRVVALGEVEFFQRT